MSIEQPADCRPLADYIGDLIDTLASRHQHHFARLRDVVGASAARIQVDDEVVDVCFEGDQLVVDPGGTRAVEGSGTTDTATVLDVLDGVLEVSDAIHRDRLHVVGAADSVSRMFVALEILLDASARGPDLQRIAAQFRADPCHQRVLEAHAEVGQLGKYPQAVSDAELELLASLGLLPRR